MSRLSRIKIQGAFRSPAPHVERTLLRSTYVAGLVSVLTKVAQSLKAQEGKGEVRDTGSIVE